MSNVIKPLARDANNEEMQQYPAPYISLTRNNATAAAASSVVSLNPNTTHLEVGAFGGQGAVIRWIPTSEIASVSPFASVISSGLGANYDHYVPPSTFRRFVIPKETQGSYQGQAGSIMGSYQRVAVAPAGIGVSSILLSEF